MSEGSIWTFIHWLSLLALAVLAVCVRLVYLAKTHGRVEIGGTVVDVRSVLVGEFPTPFIDFEYEFEAKRLTAFDLNTHDGDFDNYLPGRIVTLLIDPEDPANCRVKMPATFVDGILQNFVTGRSMRRDVQSHSMNNLDIVPPDQK